MADTRRTRPRGGAAAPSARTGTAATPNATGDLLEVLLVQFLFVFVAHSLPGLSLAFRFARNQRALKWIEASGMPVGNGNDAAAIRAKHFGLRVLLASARHNGAAMNALHKFAT